MHSDCKGERAEPGSFRDPAGFVFSRDGRIFRQVNRAAEEDFRLLIDSGLHEELVAGGMLVPHEEVDEPPLEPALAWRVLRPEPVPFISYPQEWCFGQLRDAALLTLALQKRALGRGLTLKDASAYNVQFHGARALHIDTLSFARYREGEPWVAYRQFCEHFLAPLALSGMVDGRLGRLSGLHPDGVPLELASALLPMRSWLKPGLALHLHLHAGFQRRYSGSASATPGRRLSRHGMLALVDDLERAVRAVRYRPAPSAWTGYAEQTEEAYRARKLAAVRSCLGGRRLARVLDLGANMGDFSRDAVADDGLVVAVDGDAAVVDAHYRAAREQGRRNVLPLVIDLANPTPGFGWANAERRPFLRRARADLVLALALVHHLAIGNNVPLPRIARLLHELGPELLVEFVPETDPQAARLIAARRGLTHAYDRAAFENAFGARFGRIVASHPLSDSGRTLYRFGSDA